MRFHQLSIALSCVLLATTSLAAPARKPARAPTQTPAPASLASPVKIEFSHRLDEAQAEELEKLVNDFNGSQKDVQVALVRRGEIDMPKQLNLATTEEYARFMAKKAKFKPIHEVIRDAKIPLSANQISPDLRGNGAASSPLLALPLAFSTPVFYYNKAAFRKAGLDPESPPKTWSDVQDAAGKLAANENCVFTTSWPAWVMVDNMSAWNNAPSVDARKTLSFNGLVQVKHMAMMASWHKAGFFSYFGRRDEADNRFNAGECAMLTSSSALYAALRQNKKLDFGVSPLPYHADEYGTPKNTLADGASLWVAAGLKPAESKGVGKFISYILSPEFQIKLTVGGGYLPMTPVARATATSRLLKEDLAGLTIAYQQLHGKNVIPSIRVSQIEAVRTIVDEELEAIWGQKKSSKEALDEAVRRGNAALRGTSSPVSRKAKK